MDEDVKNIVLSIGQLSAIMVTASFNHAYNHLC